MTEHSLSDPDETPEDVASLYLWANLHGGKYRDFSASRAKTREKARQRVEELLEKQRLIARQEMGSQTAAEAAAERAAQEVAQQRAREAAELAAREAQAARQAAHKPAWPLAPSPFADAAHSKQRAPWLPDGDLENPIRPARLTQECAELQNQPPLPPLSRDTSQGSRDRLASRWFALGSVFEDNDRAQSVPAPEVAPAPVLAVFSLAGGVGKTSLVATLGRVLSSRGERVLLVDTNAYGLLPFFFGAVDQRPGILRTFSPPIASGDAPIQLITLDSETPGPEAAAGEGLITEIRKHARGASRVVVDLATASAAITRRVMRLSPRILVPLVPDMSSAVSVNAIDAFFNQYRGSGSPAPPHYVLNQFDPSLPLHLDIREVLREQLGDRLLPFALRHTPAVSEALAEGMTLIDYAPGAPEAEDYASLAGWVMNLSAPVSTSYSGVRWSER